MHCDDFTRTDAERRSRLQAPISRRRLLQAGLGATISLYAAGSMPLARAFEAAEGQRRRRARRPDPGQRLRPRRPGSARHRRAGRSYGRYADLRPALKVAQPLDIGGGFGVHPALGEGLNGGLKGLFDRGRLGFIPGIDYANPDLSHFNSRHFWETGLISISPAPGWLARWTDRHGGPDNPFQALSMDASLSPLLRGSRNPVAAVAVARRRPVVGPRRLGRVAGPHDGALRGHRRAAPARPWGGRRVRRRAPEPARGARAEALRQGRKDRRRSARAAGRLPRRRHREGTNGFAENLRYLAALLTLPLGIRVATVDAPGEFDTHDDQAATLVRDLAQLSQGLSAFQADLEARGIADRVLTLVWTEFGRRPQENSSGGTDHGAGGIAWVMGARARGGLLSPYPDLNAFDGDDNLKVTTDFRAVYASLLEQWLGTGADEVLPDAGRVGRVALVA